MSDIQREYIITEKVLLEEIISEAKGREIVIYPNGIKIEGRTKTVEYKFKNLSENFLQTIKNLKNGKQN